MILDATDNFETRYLINDYAVKNEVPWIYAAAVASYCVTMNVLPGETACLACVFPAGPKGTFATCDTAGILGAAVNYVASIEAAECMKLLVGARDKLRRTLLSYDVWTNDGARDLDGQAARGLPSAAEGATSCIWRARGARTSRCAAGTRCRSTSASGRSISERSKGG